MSVSVRIRCKCSGAIVATFTIGADIDEPAGLVVDSWHVVMTDGEIVRTPRQRSCDSIEAFQDEAATPTDADGDPLGFHVWCPKCGADDDLPIEAWKRLRRAAAGGGGGNVNVSLDPRARVFDMSRLIG